MNRPSTFFALGLALSAAIAACSDDATRTEPVMTPSIERAGGGATPITDEKQLAELRKVTARFESLETAKRAGYSTQITPCWAHHSAGGMGYHYGDTNLFDANVNLLRPETVIYEPKRGGKMKLVGMEYIVPLDAWAAAHHDLDDPNDVPRLLGQKFTRHSFLPIFKLHIWLWQKNPTGMFADWNPEVSCRFADSTEVF